jgi:hypothetical protein
MVRLGGCEAGIRALRPTRLRFICSVSVYPLAGGPRDLSGPAGLSLPSGATRCG